MSNWRLRFSHNETSFDWAFHELCFIDFSELEKSIDAVFENDNAEYVECLDALAAIDKLARMKNNFDVQGACTEPVDSSVSFPPIDPPKDLVEKALKVLEMLVSESNALNDTWCGLRENEDWKTGIIALESMLKA